MTRKESLCNDQVYVGYQHIDLHDQDRPKKVRAAFKRNADYLSMSAVTLGEMIHRAEKSAQVARNLEDIEGLAARMDVLPFDYKAAAHFGQVRAELVKTGQSHRPL